MRKSLTYWSILILFSISLVFGEWALSDKIQNSLDRGAASLIGQAQQKKPEKMAKFLTNEVYIKFKKSYRGNIKEGNPKDTGSISLNKINQKYNVQKFEKPLKPGRKSIASAEIFSWYKLTLPETKNIVDLSNIPHSFKATIEELESNPEIEAVDLSYIGELFYAPDDPYYASANSWHQGYDDLWNLKKISVGGAWDASRGDGITVAIIDTGFGFDHEDGSANVWINAEEIPNNNKDDDGNGYIDDVRGWDFLGGINLNTSNNPIDLTGHGTHVGGIVSAVGNNTKGVVGVAPSSSIMILKVQDDLSGYVKTAIVPDAIVYATDKNAQVINMSFGTYSDNEDDILTREKDAINYAYNKGVVLIAGAGNGINNPGTPTDVNYSYPAKFNNVIAVAGTTQSDNRWSCSNFGYKIDLSAPGGADGFCTASNILSLFPSYSNYDSTILQGIKSQGFVLGNNYFRLAGTSMSAPHVAGLAALIRSRHPSWTPEEVRQAMRVSVDDLGDSGVDINFGAGRINAVKALSVDSVLSVKITSPSYNEKITSQTDPYTVNVPIIGTASGLNFNSYQLFYIKEESGRYYTTNSSDWMPISGLMTTPINNGLLTNWSINMKESGNGYYLIKLIATDKNGVQYSDTIKRILVEGTEYILSNYANVPDIFGNTVTYTCSSQICFYDVFEKIERKISSSRQNGGPSISGKKIVYSDNRFNYNNGDIYLYDMASGTEQLISGGPQAEVAPDISGNKIVWFDTIIKVNPNVRFIPSGMSPNEYQNIYVYDIASSTKQLVVSNNNSKIGRPKIFSNKIVWAEARNHFSCVGEIYPYDIFMYDLSTGQEKQITDMAQLNQGIVGACRYGVWADAFRPSISDKGIAYETDRNDNSDIYFYDFGINADVRITTALVGYQENSDISGDKIVWEDSRGNYYDASHIFHSSKDVYMYDLTKNKEQQITANIDYNETNPVVSNNRIIYVGNCTTSFNSLCLYDLNDDTISPLVSIINPLTNTSYVEEKTGLIIGASATDNKGIDYVEFYDGVKLMGIDSNSPYEYAWSFTEKDNGTHIWTAKAYDLSGRSAISSAVALIVKIDKTPPSVSIFAPTNGSTVKKGSRVDIMASVGDNMDSTGLPKVEFYIDNKLTCTDTSFIYSCSWRVPSKTGITYSIQAKAYDKAGNIAVSDVIKVTAK